MTYGARNYGSRPYGDGGGSTAAPAPPNPSITFSGNGTTTWLNTPFPSTQYTLAGTGTFTGFQSVPASTFSGTGTFTPTATAVRFGNVMSFNGTSGLTINAVPQGFNPADPGAIYKYTVILMNRTSKVIDLDNAIVKNLTWELNNFGTATFAMPKNDAKSAQISVPGSEVQIWRGTQLLWWGPVVRATTDNDWTTYQCAGLEWYFTKRVIGRANRTNYVQNGSFEDGKAYWWEFVHDPREPIANRGNPATWVVTVVTNPVLSGTRAISINRPSDSLPKYGTKIEQFFNWEPDPGNAPDGEEWTGVVWIYIPSASYRGPFMQESGATGLFLARFSTVDFDYVTADDGSVSFQWRPIETTRYGIDDNTPKDTWTRIELPLLQPVNPGVPETIHFGIEGCRGVTIADRISLTRNEALAEIGKDQALIAQAIVQHIQDTTYGKDDLQIGTNTPLTGVIRSRRYPFSEHALAMDLLQEFASLHGGFDWNIEITPTKRTFTTYFPYKGTRRPNQTLELGRNIASVTYDEDGDQVATGVIVMGDGEGSDREEGGSVDTSVVGVVLEKVYNATPGSSVETLEQQAERGVNRYKRAVIMPQLRTYEGGGGLIPFVRVGDVVPCYATSGRVTMAGDYRIYTMTLDPMTDVLTLTVNPWHPEDYT